MSSVNPDIIVQMTPSGAILKRGIKIAVNVVLILVFTFIYGFAFEKDTEAPAGKKFLEGLHRSALIQTTVGLGSYVPETDAERNVMTLQVIIMFIVNFVL